jgi:hypothetical protein
MNATYAIILGAHRGTTTNERKKKMPKYDVNIEGSIYEWDRGAITVAEIRQLAGFAAGQEVIEVDLKDQSEHVLAEGETVELKPGKGFGKKVSFKRG